MTFPRSSPFYQPGSNEATALSPNFGDGTYRPGEGTHCPREGTYHRPASVPSLLCCDKDHTHLLAFQSLEKTLRDVLEPLLNKNGSSDPRTMFYTKFKEEVDEHDDDLQKMHGGDLDTTLIFVSLFPLTEPTWLMRSGGWSVLGHNLRIHNRHSVRTQAGLPRNE